ncbi:MAG TPA: hypothetical protein VH083_24465 [Myxococcales bacterium]|jgi:hypothetical protein|nr:hypothetical protein [Myxococcales bacterium]
MSSRIPEAAQELKLATAAVVRACIAHKQQELQRAREWAASAREELRAELWAAAVIQPVAAACQRR